MPISSPIEVQFSIAPGTAMAQKRAGGRGPTIVVGGDAGTAEDDFATCLIWSSRPVNPLPVLMIVTNNNWEPLRFSVLPDSLPGERVVVEGD